MEFGQQNMHNKSIAVIMTCHNRRDTTLRCLNSLFKQDHYAEYDIKIFLLDDGSTDGTANAVLSLNPDIRVIHGDGSLFWCGGMRKAWMEALKDDFDSYVWLNDDVELYTTALHDLFSTYWVLTEKHGDQIMVCGSFRDPITNKRSYGGQAGERLIEPDGQPHEIDIFAGNLVLVPRAVMRINGILEKRFTHGLGDYDYALRARKKKIRIFTATNYQGTCSANVGVSWYDPDKSLAQRWTIMHGPKGPPPKEYMLYVWRHKKLKMPFSILKMYLRVLFPFLFRRS
jgi:GT2 family glycosyltransferase